jgi:hypothetical protein
VRLRPAGASLWPLALVLLRLLPGGECRAAGVTEPGFAGQRTVVYATLAEMFDSNIFRIPGDPALYGVQLPPGATRSDNYTSGGVGITATVTPARQAITLDGHFNRVDYDHNSFLNHNAASGTLSWDWQAGTTLSGTVSANYASTIADFVNNRVFKRDPIDSNSEKASLRWDAAAHLAVHFSAATSKVDHQQDEQKYQDNRTEHYSTEMDYVFGPQNNLGVVYQEVQGNFADPTFSYRDKSVLGKLDYFISQNTSINIDGGWYRRNYDHTEQSNYSGAAAHFLLRWQPTPLTTIGLSADRELNAYLHNEANYYVTDGAALHIGWTPTSRWTTELIGSLEQQDYKGSGLGTLAIVRQDHLRAVTLKATWSPYRRLELNLSESFEKRQSSDNYFSYTDNLASAQVRVRW